MACRVKGECRPWEPMEAMLRQGCLLRSGRHRWAQFEETREGKVSLGRTLLEVT